MADATDDRRIGTVIAGYRIESRIGRGGMGVVYRAEHLKLERRAALKLIAPDLAESSGFRERFSREARIAAALTHPNIVPVYDAGEVEGTLYLAMQFIDGSDLARTLSEDGRLKPYRAVDVCRQVAGALDAAHAAGLIHRDVKPANVLIEGRVAYLTDFGLTKRAGGGQAPLTNAGDVVGTIHYVAPEQIEGRELTARSDVYSLGCVLYHCLTGQMPYDARRRRRGHLRPPLRVAAAPLARAPRAAARPRRGDRASARQVARAALRVLRGPDDRGARRGRRRRPAVGDAAAADAGAPVGRGTGVDAAIGEIRSAAAASATPRRPRPPRRGHPRPTARPPPRRPTRAAEPRPTAPPPRRPTAHRRAVRPLRRRRAARAARASCSPASTRAPARSRTSPSAAAPTSARPRARARWTRPATPARTSSSSAGRAPPEVVGALRADPLTRDSKLLLVVDESAGRDPRAAGADERLATPFSPLQLQVKLRKLLGVDAVGA